MSRLIILGNGFDLNYGLPTSYRDNLRLILQQIDSQKFRKLNNLYFNQDVEYWSDFESRVGRVLNTEFLHDDLEDNLNQLYEVDVHGYPSEHKLYGDSYTPVDNAIYEAASKRVDLETWFKETHSEDFEDFQSYICDGFQKMAYESNLYLEKKLPLYKDFNFTEDDYFITFNYTSTLELIYNTISHNRIFHIHGGGPEEFELIFGNLEEEIGGDKSTFYTENPNNPRTEYISEYPSNYEDFIDQVNYTQEEIDAYNGFVDTVLRNVNIGMVKDLQENELRQFLDNLDDANIDEIWVFGLSVGKVDVVYLEIINEFFSEARWQFSFFRERSRDPIVENIKKLSFYDKISLLETSTFKKLL